MKEKREEGRGGKEEGILHAGSFQLLSNAFMKESPPETIIAIVSLN